MSESVFQSIVNTLPMGMMIFDEDENLIHSNNFAEDVFANYFEEYIVISLSDLFEAIKMEKNSESSVTAESYTVVRDSATLVFSIYPIQDEESKNFTAVRIVNISGQKNNIEKQEKQVSDLLWKTRARLTNLMNALEILSSGMEIDEEMQKDIFNSSRVELFQIGRFFDNFRELTLINSNLLQQSLELEKINLSDVVEEAISNFTVYAKSIDKYYSLSNKCKKDIYVFADRYRMLRITESLLLNSLTYADNGVLIEIEMYSTLDAVKLNVKDTGWGIEDDDQGNIFSYTFRGKNSEHSDHHGIGSELFICRQLLTKMHGEITFSSKAGEGTTFNISFPVNPKDVV